MVKLNAFDKACPLPVIMVKNEIEKETYNGENIEIDVDNYVAVENLRKLAKSYNVEISYTEIDGGYRVNFDINGKKIDKVVDISLDNTSKTAYLITHDILGGGDETLGRNLMEMMIYSILQMDNTPESISFMNAGVKLATCNDEVIETLKELNAKGVKILICGTCLNFYNLIDKVQVGEVSNAYEILSELQDATVIQF